ncbi:MAG: lipopolysaccharide heptosyltransferase II, partial [Myxococcota bacterium]
VMATPALRALRAAHLDAEIVLEGRPFLAGLVKGLPSIDEFLPDPGRTWARVRGLRRRRFDWAVLLPDSVRAALAPRLAGIPLRVGYARDRLRRALLSDALSPPMEGAGRVPLSMVERYRRITRRLDCPDVGEGLDLVVDEAARARMEERLQGSGVEPGAPYLVVTPGASYGSSKLWPTASFAAACDAISARHGLQVLLAPGPGEEAIAGEIVRAMHEPALSFQDPPTSLAELVALLDGARLQLGNDTGPRHVAVALGVPAVVVMGPTDPRHTAHLLERQRVLRVEVDCSPCGLKRCPIDHRCMTRVAPEQVAAAAAELLG